MKEEKKLICIRFDNSLCLAFRTCVCLYSLYSRYRYSQRYIHISYKADTVEGVRSMRHVILMCVREAGECRCGRFDFWPRRRFWPSRLRLLSGSPSHILLLCFGTPLDWPGHHFGAMTRLNTHIIWIPNTCCCRIDWLCGQNKNRGEERDLMRFLLRPSGRFKIYFFRLHAVPSYLVSG